MGQLRLGFSNWGPGNLCRRIRVLLRAVRQTGAKIELAGDAALKSRKGSRCERFHGAIQFVDKLLQGLEVLFRSRVREEGCGT